ncbi:TonB-dependent receptor [Pseudoalteromonas sp. MM17-2]|uniref:TonB-dependent receptor domain-containing protein n=1 Tax=Pseudoalteromonas sp. MM17-2 TaxID=2917753 RepID=UPI001EF53764|nr:TonB-dependent receptor [Pseudoalteromonas sp. MM17-2]MCG7543410.1 TonB-dependent receptor [Pseudoalteromonas sp. MM17-2]
MYNKTKVAAGIAALFSGAVFAQQQQSIERLTVTANKFEQPIENVLASIDVITRADIERLGVRDLPALLSNYAGVDIVRSGGQGQSTSLFIRGAASSHSLVIVDGVRVGSATTGYKALSSVPLNSIERVEVIRGARAAWYGSDALAGVINIVTRDGDSQSVSVQSGSDNYVNAQGAFAFRQGAFNAAFNLGYEHTDGFDVTTGQDPDEDGYENQNLGARFGYDLGDYGVLELLGQYSEGYVEYDTSFGDDYTDFEKYHVQLGWRKNHGAFAHKLQTSLAQDDEINTQQHGAPGYRGNEYSTARDELSYQLNYVFSPAITVSGGADYYYEDISDSYSSSATPEQPASGFTVQTRNNKGVYVGGYYDGQAFNTNAVVRHDDHSQFGGHFTYNLAAGVPLSDIATFRASYGTAFKAPSFNDASSIWGSNDALQPEESNNAELGLRLDLQSGQYDIALYQNQFDNLIAWGNNGPENIAKASFEGVELSAQVQDMFGIDHQLNFSYVDAEDDNTGQALVLRAEKTLNWSVGKQFDKWYVGAQLQYRSDRLSYYRTDLPSYTLVNLNARYQLLRDLTFTFGVDNLTDKEYITNVAATDWSTGEVTSAYRGAERKVYAGLQFDL